MPAAALHGDEAVRLRALRSYDILDTPRESDFDDIVELLAEMCDAPISVINLVDEGRQWFKAEVGLGVRETPIGSSICAHAILQKGTMIVPDTREDARFSDNPLVSGDRGLRFYAGALLETSNGLPLGTLCLLDYRPRTLTEQQVRMMSVLARQVMAQMELKRALKVEREARKSADAALVERNLLAQEIDHRVKNSLQMVSGMLQMQARRAEPEVARQLREAESRVLSVAAVHEQLYRAGSTAGVETRDFLSLLSQSIGATAPAGIMVTLRCDEGLLSAERSAALGLILNELVANAFKHAFIGAETGEVAIHLIRAEDVWELTVRDDGGGYAVQEGPTGLGTRIITALVQRLDGQLERRDAWPGTEIKVRFPVRDN